ncbi:hypothetical protein AJ80_07620 [Polytolypa hystricis UAMH7299]|uniref:Zn(2)-C6 fungal-type domain-containing protein n=1 Tax=Polytolypa hystricis (strain UAMH7299) TaxID=1447883 RepID=A0A2B7XLU8_POLH7|nr:hypothetical protein AJ80_07620 [Polytolypa hystricis UAMH7299]
MSDTAGDSDGGDSHRRKRIRQACLNCRRKKVRCGGEKPVCTFCSRLSQLCVYAEDGRSARRASMPRAVDDDEALDFIAASYTCSEYLRLAKGSQLTLLRAERPQI